MSMGDLPSVCCRFRLQTDCRSVNVSMTDRWSVCKEKRREPVQLDAMMKRAEQGRATRDHLVEVATRLFSEQGYEDTSIEDVLTAAGVSRGALYHHFAGKEALFEATLQLIEDRVMVDLQAVISGAPNAVTALHTAAVAWI